MTVTGDIINQFIPKPFAQMPVFEQAFFIDNGAAIDLIEDRKPLLKPVDIQTR